MSHPFSQPVLLRRYPLSLSKLPVRSNPFLFTFQSGFTLVESIIATVLLAIIITAFLGSLLSLGFSQLRSKAKTQGTQFAREAAEITYNLSLQDWDTFSQLEGEYHLVPRSTPNFDLAFPFYDLDPGSQLLQDRYTQTITFSPAIRDSSGNIVDTKTDETDYDPATRKVRVTITWQLANQPEEVQLVTYLMNLKSSLSNP